MWTCLKCGEESEDQFGACWNCGVERGSTKVGPKGPDRGAGPERNVPGAASNGGTEQKKPKGLAKRYSNAYAVANALVALGSVVKAIGVILAILIGLVSLIVGSQTSASIGLAGAVMGIVLGLVVYLLGVLLAALGQILRATLDTAVNTSPFLDDKARKEIMSLP
jgi:hypothetical protein